MEKCAEGEACETLSAKVYHYAPQREFAEATNGLICKNAHAAA